jgi:putative flippase GtrA
MTREALRGLRFCIVGVTNTAVGVGVFALLVALGLSAPLASAIAFCAGATNSYQLNRRWTFSGLGRAHHAVVRFVVAQGFGALASAGGVLVLIHAGWPRLAAECVILPCVTVALYSVSRLLVFRSASV